MAKERGQNPTIGDTLRLRLYIFNSNNPADVVSVDSINLYHLDPTEVTAENPTGKTLIQTLDVTQVVHDATGSYYIDVNITDPEFVIGYYVDEWSVTFDSNMPSGTIAENFRIYPSLWYASSKPILYDFSFHFLPNKVRRKSIQYLRVKITPNVPTGTDLEKYYENLAILADISISMEQKCGPCLPSEEDLRSVLDCEPMDYRDNCYGYYQLDTTELDSGIYSIWFTLKIGSNVYLSDKMNFQIFD